LIQVSEKKILARTQGVPCRTERLADELFDFRFAPPLSLIEYFPAHRWLFAAVRRDRKSVFLAGKNGKIVLGGNVAAKGARIVEAFVREAATHG
jgi:hypothetical protein